MSTELKNVLKLFITEAAFLNGSKKRQMGYDKTTKRMLLHNNSDDTLAWAVSDDSLQVLKAGSQDIGGEKTFKADVLINGTNKLFINSSSLGVLDHDGTILSLSAGGVGKALFLKANNIQQINLGISGIEFVTNTILELKADATRGAPASTGRIIYNTDDDKINIDTGVDWTLADGSVT